MASWTRLRSSLPQFQRSVKPTPQFFSFSTTTKPSNRLTMSSRPRHSAQISSSWGRRFMTNFQDTYSHDRQTTKRTILYGMIGTNIAVFLAWSFHDTTRRKGDFNITKLGRFLAENFILSRDHVRSGRWWTVITAAFSQRDGFHLLGNMISMWAFGSVLMVVPSVTPLGLLTLIFGSALASSAASLNDARGRPALGSSGIVMGLAAAAACIMPKAPFLLMGIIPAPLWVLAVGYGLYDYARLGSQTSRVGHAAHLGGGCFGLAYYLLALRRPTQAMKAWNSGRPRR